MRRFYHHEKKNFVRRNREYETKRDVNFSQEGSKRNPTTPGTYMTIRSGLTGIYKMINVWENDKWQIEVLDASSTIAEVKDH